MKKYLIGLFVIFAFAIGMCSCVIVHDNDDRDDFTTIKTYRGYFANESYYSITAWGAVDVDSGRTYQSDDDDINWISSGYENGPIYVPEDAQVKMHMRFYRDRNEWTTPGSYTVRRNFTFHLYYDDSYDWERRQAGAVVEPRPYLRDDEGNIILLEKVTTGSKLKEFNVE